MDKPIIRPPSEEFLRQLAELDTPPIIDMCLHSIATRFEPNVARCVRCGARFENYDWWCIEGYTFSDTYYKKYFACADPETARAAALESGKVEQVIGASQVVTR